MTFDVEKAVDSILAAVAVPLAAMAARLRAIEARPAVDVKDIEKRLSDLERAYAELELQVEAGAEKDRLSRRELAVSVSEAINSVQVRR